MPKSVVLYSIVGAVSSAAVLAIIAISRPAYRQTPDKVVVRKPGRRFLGPLQDAQPFASEDLPYALLSAAAYNDIPKGKPDDDAFELDPKAILQSQGWVMWDDDFPSQELKAEMDLAHLRAEVWSNESLGLVVVAFGGTVFSNWKDWESNLRWFKPRRNDEYTLTSGRFARSFAAEFERRSGIPGQEFLKTAVVHTTGHSLGGGLAQQFAYALPANADGTPRVKKVYAFDPSPVTGFKSTSKLERNENKIGLQIDRIYERGEVLSIVRSITNALYKPAAVNPQIRQLRYNLFGNDRFGLGDAIGGHSIWELTYGLSKAAAGKLTPTSRVRD
jgi:hypothetical protein